MRDRERAHAKPLVLDDRPRRDRDRPDLEPRPPARPDHLRQQAPRRPQRGAAAEEREPAARPQQSQRRGEPAQPQQMIGIGMGQQHAVQPAQPEPALQQLALRPLAAVDQEPSLAVDHDQRRQPPLDRRHAGRGAEKNDFEHAPTAPCLPVAAGLPRPARRCQRAGTQDRGLADDTYKTVASAAAPTGSAPARGRSPGSVTRRQPAHFRPSSFPISASSASTSGRRRP
jgi:hypothetical protein